MARTWILVADAAEARIMTTDKDVQQAHLAEEYSNPTARMLLSELVTDRAGRSESGGQRHAYEKHGDTKTEAVRAFARQLAARLEKGLQAREYASLKVVASPAFLGELRKQFSPAVAAVVTAEVARDLIKEPASQVPAHLAQLFA